MKENCQSLMLATCRCVRTELTTEGAFRRVWDDAGSGARADVSFHQVLTLNERLIKLGFMNLNLSENHECPTLCAWVNLTLKLFLTRNQHEKFE